MKRTIFSIVLMSIAALFVACDSNEPVVDEPINDPIITIDTGATTAESITFTITSQDAESVAFLVLDAKEGAPSSATIFSAGAAIDANKAVTMTVEELMPKTQYIVAAAAKAGNKSATTTTKVTTLAEDINDEVETLVEEFASAKRILTEDAEENVYALEFEAEGVKLALELNAMGGDMLPKGVYTPGDTRFNLNLENTALEYNGAEVRFAGGNVRVDVDAENSYTFAITLSSEDLKLVASYEGLVENMPKTEEPGPGPGPGPEPEPVEIVFTSASSSWRGADHILTLTTEDGSAKLVADIYTYNQNFGYLDAGVYTVINTGYSFHAGEIDYYYSTYEFEGDKQQLDSGTITVVINEDLTYNIVVDVVDAAGRELKSEYNGVVEGMSFVNGFTWVAASRNKVNGGADGQFNITFKTAGADYADYLTLDFYAEAGASRLPAGTYTISDSTEAGNVDVSTIAFTTFSNGSPVIDGGEVVVEYDEESDKYSVSFHMEEKDSFRIWECSYEGTIYNMIISTEVVELTFVSASASYSDDSCEWSVYLTTDTGKQLKLGIIDLAWNTSYITSGTYNVGNSWAAGEIYSGWYGTDWNDGVGFKEGSAVFQKSGKGIYNIGVNVILSNDEVYEGRYSGPVQGINQ